MHQKINQSHVSVGKGKVIAGDNTENYYGAQTELSLLDEALQTELEDKITTDERLDALLHLTRQVDVTIRSLEEKLTAAGHADLIRYALESKELFYKKLLKYELYPSAQKIFARVLAAAWDRFELAVLPKVKRNASTEEIASAIREFSKEMQDSFRTNTMCIYDNELTGSVFYLTGTCRLGWE